MSSTKTFSVEQLLAHSGWARSLARQLVVDAAAADDVVQESLVAAIRQRPAADRPLRPWLERVVRNFAANSRRSRRTRQQHEAAAAPASPSAPAVDEVVAKAEGQQQVTSAVLALAEPYRTVVLLRFFEGLSSAEIARRQLVPPGTVRWRLSTGLQQLREQLDADAKGDRHAWCLALLPLTGFRAVGELAAVAPWQAAARTVHPSWTSTVTGVLAMKNAWMMAVVVGMLAVSWLWWPGLGGGGLVPESGTVAGLPVVRVEQARETAPAQVADVERENAVESVADAIGDDPAEAESEANRSWRAHLRVRFVTSVGIGVPGVKVRFARGDALESDGVGQVLLPVPAPFGGQPRHLAGLELIASHPEFATIRRGVAVSGLRGSGDHVELGTLTLERGGSIAGTVVDASGNPVVGASVSAEGRSRASARAGSVLEMSLVSRDGVGAVRGKTDAQGRFRLDGVLLGNNTVRASFQSTDSWVDDLEAERSIQVALGVVAQAELRVARAIPEERILTVHCVDPDGQPVARAYVQARSNYGNSMTSANAKGVARVGFARGGRSVDLTVSAPDQRYATVVHEGAQLGEVVTIAFRPVVPLPLTLEVVAGRAVESAHIVVRTVASGGFLGFGGKRAEELNRADYKVSASDGSVAGLRLPSVRFELEVRCSGYEQGTFGPFEPDQARAGLSLTLVASAMVSGSVRSLMGEPLANVNVTLHRRPERRTRYNGFDVWLDPQPVERCTTDEHGAYAMTLRGQRSFLVRAEREDMAATLSSEQSVPQSGGLTLDLVLHGGGVLAGKVLRGDARNPAGAIVVANRGDGFARTVRADEHGAYRFERMQPGAYEVKLTSEELGTGSSRSTTTFGSVPRELESPNCQVEIGRETRFDITPPFVLDAELAGSIRIAGWPLAGARLAVELAEVPEGQVSAGEWHSTLDTQGRFSLPSLPSGRVVLKLAAGPARLQLQTHLVAGKNRYALDLETREVALRDLPLQAADGTAVFVMARWRQEDSEIFVPIEVAQDGTAKVRLPRGAVTLERSPTPADGMALLARGKIGMIKLREIVVE